MDGAGDQFLAGSGFPENESGRIIRQAFAFKDDERAPWDMHAPRDGERCHGIRRRNDRANYEADRPRKTEQPMHGGGHRDGGENDAPDRQQSNGSQVEVIAPDEAMKAILASVGGNPLDPSVRDLAARAGRDQGRSIASRVAALWQ